ncbi:hypothetical protein JL367_004323 [Escherichia coli]|uniref:hypothetical protein n=2 Tax=Escherichia coli TaxID=562 RepID=UPI001DF1EB06|nr:hypothetical protein [Escherichia coli]EEL3206056.1 hypothetical protein [Salmonella enterica]EKG7231243.1 hypothetical protein [Escherichia coli]MDT9115514.1 hypothetical protein [Escherichia coli]
MTTRKPSIYPAVNAKRAMCAYFDVIDGCKAIGRTDLERLNAERMAAAWHFAKCVVLAKRRNRDFYQNDANIVSIASCAPADLPFQFDSVDAWQMWLDAQRMVGGDA